MPPPLLRLEIVSLIISGIVAASLALMVLQFKSRRLLNRLFILFTTAEAVWAASAFSMRLSLLFETSYTPFLFELSGLGFSLMIPLLLAFTVRYLGLRTRRADMAAILLSGIALLSTIPLFQHKLILNPRMDDNGVISYDINTWGFLMGLLSILYLLWALVLFWRERRRIKEPYLAFSVLALLLGFGLGGLLGVPLISPIMNTISVISMGYGVISQQIFNPLRELAEELEQRVAERTQELAQASNQLTTIHTLGQKLVLSKNTAGIARLVVDAARQVLRVPICGLWIVNKEQKALTLWAHTGERDIRQVPPFPLDSERSIVVAVTRSGEPIYLPDVSQDPRYVGGEYQTRSELCVPLQVGQQVLGALNAESETLDSFGATDRQLLEALANSTAIAIHNARLHEQTLKRTERLAVVNNIASVASAILHPGDVMEIVYLEIVSTFHTDIFSIALHDEKTDELDFCFEMHSGVRQPPVRIPMGVGLDSVVVTVKQPLLIRDLERDKEHLPPQALSGTKKPAISWLGVPMLIGKRVIGAISIQAHRPHAWDKEDELLLSTIADQVAVALEKARLFQERERRVTELALVNEIGQAISSISEMDALLETVHQQVGRLFDTANFYIATYAETSHEWAIAFDVEQGERQPTGRRFTIETGFTGYIIRNRQPLVFQSNEEITAWQKSQGIDIVGQIKSWMGFPLVAADEIVGVMTIQNYERESLYSKQDRALFSTIAAQVATAMGNLQMLEKARRRAQEMEAINEIGGTITSVLDLDTMLHQITDITKTRFGHYFVGIALAEGERLVFRSGSMVGDSGVRFEYGKLTVSLTHKSLVAEAWRSGRPVLANDTHDDPRHLAAPGLPDTRCELCIPIKAKRRVIGVLDVQSDRPSAYDQSDVALLQSLADQAGVGIHNVRLYQETQQQLREQTMLFDASQSLANTPLQAEEIAETAARQLADVLDVSECSFSLLTPKRDALRVLADFWIEEKTKHWTRVGELSALQDFAATARVIEKIKPLVIQANDPDANPAELAYMQENTSATLAIFPLAVKGQSIGIMKLETWEERHYTSGQFNTAMTLANQVAAALENARLYEETQQQLQEQRMLFTASQGLANAPLDAEAIVRVAARQLAEAIEDAECSFSLLNPQTGILRVLADLKVKNGVAHWYELDESFTLSEYPAAARVIETLEPLVVQASDPDADVDPSELAYMQKNKTATLAIFPLAVKGQGIGIMALETEKERHYTPAQLNMATTLANQVSVALENARLYEAMQLELIERERAEAALRESEEQYRLLFNSGSDLVLVHPLTAEGSPGKFIAVNDVACQRLGYSKRELLGLSPADINAREESTDAPSPTTDLLTTGRAIFEGVLVARDGVRISVENSARVFDLRGQPTVLTIARDITERKLAEEQLRRYAAELEESNEEVKRFAYVVSHDLRAPLVNLKGFASELGLALDEIQSVMDTVMEHLDDQQKQTITYALHEDAPEALEFINSSTVRMDHFITSLLKLSRYGRRELVLEQIDMETLIQAILKTLAHQLAERQVKVTIGPLPEAIADRTSIEQIMGNILDNAVKYLDPDRPGKFEITGERGDDETIFHVQDNGCGIAENEMDKVFTPFRRAGKQDVPGEGIGLAYVQALIRRHGGRIWCESELGAGTLISFTLPNQTEQGANHV